MDFNFNESKIKTFKNYVKKDRSYEEKRKKELYNMLDFVKRYHHHSKENVFIMPSRGDLQGKKQRIGKERFDVMAHALDEYFKDNIEKLLKTPEDKDVINNYMNSILNNPEEGKSDINLYFNRIYNIDDEKLIQDLIESGKKAIDSAQRVQEYITLAYRVWIHRSKKYGEKYDKKYYQVLIEKIRSLPSEELREELKPWIGEKI